MTTPIPTDLFNLKCQFEAWRKLELRDPKRRIVFSTPPPIHSTDIPSREFVRFARSTRALFADIPPLRRSLLCLRRLPSLNSFLSRFRSLNPNRNLQVIVGFCSSGLTELDSRSRFRT
jgi:hypothetical protein